jgi:hypothetical protein
MSGSSEASPSTLTRLPQPLDFARMKRVLAQIGLPMPDKIQVSAAAAGRGEFVRTDFGYVLAEIDDALDETPLSPEDRITFKATLTALGLMGRWP